MSPLLLLLAGCGAEDEPQPSETDAVELPSSYEYTPDESSSGAMDLAALEDDLNLLFAELLDLNAAPAVLSYETAMADSDTYCPAYYEQDGNTFWYADCTSDAGASYDGYAFYTLYEDTDLFGDGSLWDAIVISGSADIDEEDGDRYHLGGYAYYGDSLTEDLNLFISVTAGSFFAEGDEVDGTWITSSASPSLTLYAAQYVAYGINILQVSGSAPLTTGALASSDLSAVQLSLVMYTPYPGVYPCAEPWGTMAVRDAAGSWYTIEFDVTVEDDAFTAEEGTCDGCGTVSLEGDVLGEVCIDPTPLIDWEVSPW